MSSEQPDEQPSASFFSFRILFRGRCKKTTICLKTTARIIRKYDNLMTKKNFWDIAGTFLFFVFP
jgi:hypothetical protein